jgi:hypothetical protein
MMKRFLLIASVLLALTTSAVADDVQGIFYNPATGGVSASTRANGMIGVAPAPQTLTQAQATKLGLMSYTSTGTYNGGGAPTLTLSAGGGTLSSVIRAVFLPYQTMDGNWRLKMNCAVLLSTVSRTTAQIAINGVSFNSTSGYNQPVPGIVNPIFAIESYANGTSNVIEFDYSTSTTNDHYWSGDVELASKPTWAY